MKRIAPILVLLGVVLPGIALAGSQTFTPTCMQAPRAGIFFGQSNAGPCTYTFTVPAYGTLAVVVSAGGGGGGGGQAGSEPENGSGYGAAGGSGANGQASAFASVTAYGGAGGEGGGLQNATYGAAGSPGGGAGGSVEIGGGGTGGVGGVGGAVGNGVVEGISVGGSDAGGMGGAGGAVTKTYGHGELAAGTTVTVVVGGGGAGGSGAWGYCPADGGCYQNGFDGASGQPGAVTITWTDPAPAPTCSVSFDQNPLTGQSTAMHWSSSNADVFHINNVGYVSVNGQALVYNAGDYSGQVQGPGGTAACTAILKEGTQCTGSGCSGTRYSCSSNNQCVIDANGSYATADCNHQCSSAPAHYACVQHQCVSSASGPYTASNCNDACAAQCPAGQVRSGNACACANGLNINQYPICTCPSGYAQHGAACVKQGCTDPDGYYCVSNAIVHRVNCKDATFKVCAAPQSCTDGSMQCANPAIGVNVKFHAQPALVRPGQTSQLFWDVDQVSACDFSGNGESWTQVDHAVNPAGGRTTAPITGQTIYTMTCHALWGVTPASLTQRATINVVPSFNEH